MLDIIIGIIILAIVIYFINEQNKKFYETLEKIQIKYFESLKEYSRKSDLLLTKNNHEFLKVFERVFKKDIPVEVPKPLEASEVENSIETAGQPEEVLLSETDRIPIVDGVNMKFEDETEVYPMNINPLENFENKNENPIEK